MFIWVMCLIFVSYVCGFSSPFSLCVLMYGLEYVLVCLVDGIKASILVGGMCLWVVSSGLFMFLFFLCIILIECYGVFFVVFGMLLLLSLWYVVVMVIGVLLSHDLVIMLRVL